MNFLNNKTLMRIVIVVLAVILAALLLVVTMLSRQDTGNPTVPSGTQKEDQTTLVTPYGTLNYPKEWANLLRVEVSEGDPYTVTYYADLGSGKTQALFAISFGGSMETAQATLTTSGGKTVPVHVSIVEIRTDSSWSDQETTTVFTMQEAMNEVLSSLPIETITQPPLDNPDLPAENGEEMLIDTPYGELHYPARWSDYLELRVNDTDGYSVAFWCKVDGHDAVKLFTIHYGGDLGVPVGNATDGNGNAMKIRLEVLELELDDTWPSNEKSIVTAMQEDLNHLLSKLG